MPEAPHRSAPASYIQRAMWLASQRQRGTALNVMTLGWQLRGRLRVDALEAALNDLVGRHEALRTRLVMHAGQLRQVVESTCRVQLELVAVGQTSATDIRRPVQELVRAEARRPIELTVAPPLRALLVRSSDLEHVLALFVHHAVCDGWSGQVVMRDLAEFYRARATHGVANLPPLLAQYIDFTCAQIHQFENRGFSRELAYWIGELEEAPPPLELPTRVARKGNRDWNAESATSVEAPEVVGALKEYSRRRKVSLFSTALAAFSVLMHRRIGARDMLVAVSTTNRWNASAMQMVGCLTNLLPARIRIDPAESFDTLLMRVHATVRRLVAYGKLPLELILRETRGPFAFDLGLPVWCQVREAAPTLIVDPDGLAFTPMLLDRGTILADLDADLVETAAGLECVFAYRRSLFEQEWIIGLMRDYLAIMHRLARTPCGLVVAALADGIG